MIQVKWVEPNFLLSNKDRSRYTSSRRQRDMVPVIELAALTEVVEGLTSNFHSYELTLLAHHAGLTEEQLCGAAIALRWVETHLKAQLAPLTTR